MRVHASAVYRGRVHKGEISGRHGVGDKFCWYDVVGAYLVANENVRVRFSIPAPKAPEDVSVFHDYVMIRNMGLGVNVSERRDRGRVSTKFLRLSSWERASPSKQVNSVRIRVAAPKSKNPGWVQ